ncbi:Zinc finger, BED-type [Sesbania bispinosa]|nr:Zinc finger, BED-type [Sesbania bispinosa]
MGRPKDVQTWSQVTIVGKNKVKCNHCGDEFKGGVTRIKEHLDTTKQRGRSIHPCSAIGNRIPAAGPSNPQHQSGVNAANPLQGNPQQESVNAVNPLQATPIQAETFVHARPGIGNNMDFGPSNPRQSVNPVNALLATRLQAETFVDVHPGINNSMASGPSNPCQSVNAMNATRLQAETFVDVRPGIDNSIASGPATRLQAETFTDVHLDIDNIMASGPSNPWQSLTTENATLISAETFFDVRFGIGNSMAFSPSNPWQSVNAENALQVLRECDSLEHVPPLGKLQNLSRLVVSCSSIEKVPEGLEMLIKLKWLDLSGNKELWWEPESVLPNLTNMQFLDLRNTRIMLTINDLQGMTTLECFGGNFLDRENYNSYVQKILDKGFGPKTYHLHLGNICKYYFYVDCHLYPFAPNYHLQKIIYFGDCEVLPYYLPKNTSEIYIDGNYHWKCLCNGLSFERSMFSHLKVLYVRGCNKIEKLLTPELLPQLQNLERIEVRHCSSMKEIFAMGNCVDNDDGSRTNITLTPPLSERSMFSHLKELSVWGCNKIEKLLTPGLVPQLINLEGITVSDCSSMKEIFAVDNNDGSRSNITLPKLTRLYLQNLPELNIVCKGILFCGLSKPWFHSYECPNLKEPTIQTCNNR